MASVAVIGSGGREHAIVWKLRQSNLVNNIYICPGNIGCFDENKVISVDTNINNNNEIINFCNKYKIDLVVIGPEQPLANGLVDDLNSNGIKCFGPSKNAAQLESSKEFAKYFMQRHNIPTAQWQSFTDYEEARKHIENSSYNAHVIKASGLAAGKGVIVTNSNNEAIEAVDLILRQKSFGKAGETVIIEELLDGEEFSVLAFTDGTFISLMPVAQDHKTLLDGDKGPNTGGMGAYAPCPQILQNTINYIKTEIIQKTINGMRNESTPFVGVLYVGLMMTRNGPKVLEYNCRFGDPEAEVLLSLLESDLYLILNACTNGNLQNVSMKWKDDYSIGIVLASAGYPKSSGKNELIEGIDNALTTPNVNVFHAGTKKFENQLHTNGGRVLVVVATASSLIGASICAQLAVKKISFSGAQYRHDIAFKGIFRDTINENMTYANAGVDIETGDKFVNTIKCLVNSTRRKEVLGSIGGFGGCFNLNAQINYKNPILVAGTDGVGTKLKIAQTMKQYNSIGIDLVAMCVNDILTHGAEPLFFLDYFACSHLVPEIAKEVIAGISNGCVESNCALLGGETAEMPGMYNNNDFDLAGFAVGVVEHDNLVPKINISHDDIIIGLASSGIHSNGYSLIRKIIQSHDIDLNAQAPFDNEITLGAELLKPTKIYVKCLLPLFKNKLIKAAAHITGGGLVGNLPRVIPQNMIAILDAKKWVIPSIFAWLTLHGVSENEMLKTFNCGIGMALVVDNESANKVLKKLRDFNESAWIIGHIAAKDPKSTDNVIIHNMKSSLLSSIANNNALNYLMNTESRKKRVAVLISGTGTNLQALIESSNNAFSPSKIVLVISNVPDVMGLERANKYNIQTKVISHKNYKNRLEFDMAVNEILNENNIDIVCLAGFMRILTGEFVRVWRGKLLNIHPSLLPSFPGLNAHKQALDAGVRFTGCTVHFVVEAVDAGGIIVQEVVPVLMSDNEDTLSERVKLAEHKAYPHALSLLCKDLVSLSDDNKVLWL